MGYPPQGSGGGGGITPAQVWSDSTPPPGANVPAIKAKTDLIPADITTQLDTNIPAVKTKTDLIPADITTQLDTNIPAVKAKTDLIPADITTQLDTNIPAVKAKTDASLYTSRLTPVHSNTTVPANTTVDIQPPAGETWEVEMSAAYIAVGAGPALVAISYFDGTTLYGSVTKVMQASDNVWGTTKPSLGVQMHMRLTNTMYCRITWAITDISGRKLYSYSGWKE